KKLRTPYTPPYAKHTYQSYCVDLDPSVDREALMTSLLRRGIATRRGVMASHLEKVYLERIGKISLPVTEEKARTTMLIPLFAAPTAAATSCPAPTVAPTVAPGAGTAAPTLLPLIPENTNGCVTVSKIPIPPIAGKTASIDIIDIDQQAHLMYVTDRGDNGIDIFDVASPTAKYVKTVDVGSGPNGVVVAKNVNKVFAALNDSNVAIIDIATGSSTLNTVIAKLNTGGKKRADELDYDPTDKKVYVANSDDGIVTVIDATSNKILKKFDNMGDALEQPRYDSKDGMIYLTSSGQNAVFQFDPTKDVMVKKFDVGAKCDPNGIAINPTIQ